MRTIFETCEPRPDVLSHDLRDEMFAAKLHEVVLGGADEIYGQARKFFENTYPTEGMKTLVREVFGRLTGRDPTASPFIRLETSFGGGKTHNLIALYHLAQGARDGLPPGLIDPTWIPTTPIPTAGVVGSHLDPQIGVRHGDVQTRTIWGEIAYQLGNRAGFDKIRNSDEAMIAPGTQVFEDLVGDGPALIMIDEIARHLRTAKAVLTANRRSDLAEQTVAFLMSLIEFAVSKPHVAVVITLAESSDAFGEESEDLSQELEEAKRVSARQERVITPTGETEIARIVNHRLFRSVDRAAGREAGEAYVASLALAADQGTEIPPRALRAEFAAEIESDYPFHPELLNTLNRKTATIDNFQKTRGALRLLARVVAALWEKRPLDAHLIQLHHLDLSVEGIVNDLTSRLDRPQFRSVVEADIASPRSGSISHCQAIDARFIEAGKPAYAARLATGIFLHSLTQGTASGVDPSELFLAALQPGDDPGLLRKALSIMVAEERGDAGTACWYLHWDGHRYRFKTEPSLEKLVYDEMSAVTRTKAKDEIDQRVKSLWKRGVFEPEPFPSGPHEVGDDPAKPHLVIVNYDHVSVRADLAEPPPEFVARVFERTGSTDEFRKYKNHVLFLVADTDGIARMVDVARRYLALCRILSDPDRLREFTDDQRRRLQEMRDAAELEVRVAITRAYRHLYYPSSDAPRKCAGLAWIQIQPREQAKVDRDQSEALVFALHQQVDKVLTAEDTPMPAQYVKAKAWPKGQPTLSTEDLRREFAKRYELRILLDINQLKKTIRDGIRQGDWVYYVAQEDYGYGQKSPDPFVQITDDVFLYEPEEAKRRGIRIKGEDRQPPAVCPMCRKDPCQCVVPPPPRPETRVVEEGPPRQVFQRIADAFHDRKTTRIERLAIACEGSEKQAVEDLHRIGLAIPQFGKGAFQIKVLLHAEFGSAPHAGRFTIEFQGPWDLYKRFKQAVESIGKDAEKARAGVDVEARFEGGLNIEDEQYRTVREVFDQLGIGRIRVEADPCSQGEA